MCQEELLGTSKDQISNYYLMSITHKKDGLSEVFERVKPLDGKLAIFRKQIIEDRQRQKLSTDGFEKVGYYRRRMMYDCKRKDYCTLEATYYDLYGHEIKTDDPEPDKKWYKVPAATMREVELGKACR
jgi:hypothetical protein